MVTRRTDPNVVQKGGLRSRHSEDFSWAQQAARCMVPRGRGAILFTGQLQASRALRITAAFAMGKFALRGLAQSAARELGPKGIHVAHFIIDGGVRAAHRPDSVDKPDSTLDPDAIAQAYVDVFAAAAQRVSHEG